MSFEALMRKVQQLNASMEALAAIGAELRLRQEGKSSDPRIRPFLKEVLAQIDGTLLDGISADQQAIALSGIDTFFRQAFDLLENPDRSAGWAYDEKVLQAQGRLSRRIVHAIHQLGETRPLLAETLHGPGAFLDVGTGVGWLAIEAATVWPSMRVVGIDPWQAVLDIARQNVATTAVADRVELRHQGVEEFDDQEAFTLVWVAGPFLPPDIVPQALARVTRALKPGGWLVFGFYNHQADPLSHALTGLRVVRSGGHPWRIDEITDRMGALGYQHIDIGLTPTVSLVAGRKPA